MILYISDPKNSSRELLNLINSFAGGAGAVAPPTKESSAQRSGIGVPASPGTAVTLFFGLPETMRSE